MTPFPQRAIVRSKSSLDGAALFKKYSTGTNHALIIGINRYAHHRDLKTSVNDANAVAGVLQEKYFFKKRNIILLKDAQATKSNIMKSLLDLVASKVKQGDNVLIYYAGHEWFNDILKSGYWVTTEATKDSVTYLENDAVYKVIVALDRKGVQHVLLVSDSCFSGSFTKDHRAVETDIDDRYFKEKYSGPSRNILTSGGWEVWSSEGKSFSSVWYFSFDSDYEGWLTFHYSNRFRAFAVRSRGGG